MMFGKKVWIVCMALSLVAWLMLLGTGPVYAQVPLPSGENLELVGVGNGVALLAAVKFYLMFAAFSAVALGAPIFYYIIGKNE